LTFFNKDHKLVTTIADGLRHSRHAGSRGEHMWGIQALCLAIV